MLSLLKHLIFSVIVLAGAALGALLGFYGMFYACSLVDSIFGQDGGGGFVAAGWLFLVVSVPLGAYLGGQFSEAIARNLLDLSDGGDTNDEEC